MFEFFSQQSRSCSSQRGFTLIEVMVAVSIFAIVTTVGVGALVSMTASYKKSQSQRAAFDSLNFVVDTLGRDIRTGTRYVQSDDPSDFDASFMRRPGSASTAFAFRNQDGCDVTYRRIESDTVGVIQRRIQNNTQLGCTGFSGNFENLTSENIIDVTGLIFYLRGSDNTNNDAEQPMTTFVIQATTQHGSSSTEVALQTSITQRFLDIASGS